MDLDKLAQELGGKPVSDLDALAAELGGEVASTPGGYGPGTFAKDVGKLVTSGAVKGVAGAPETVQAAGSEAARESLFKPTEALNLIADPRRLANKLVGSVGLPPIFETTKEQPLVPAQVTAKQRAAVDETLSKGKIPQLRQLTEYGNKLSEDIENTISPEMKVAMAESQPTGNIIKALETGDFSEVSMGTNPTALGLTGQAVKVFGTSAPALLTALVTKSAGPATAVGFGQAGAEGIDEARNYIKNMSDEELAKKSEYFRNLIALGYSTNQARQMTEDKAADTASLAQGSVGALGGAFTAKLLQGGFDKTLLGNVKSRLGKVLQGAGIAGAEGAITEMAEGVATDLGIDKTVVREIGVDSFANLVLGAIGEAAPGVIRGAVAPGESVKGAEAPEVPPAPVTAVTPVEGAAPAIIPEGGFETEEEAAAPAVTPPAAPAAEAPEVAPAEAPAVQGQERLNKFLAEDKIELVKSIAENNNISLDYAEKVYNAEKEYREAQAKYYTPELINSPEFAAAQKKYDAFQNRLRSVVEKKKAAAPTQEEIAPTTVETVTEPIPEASKFAVDEQGEKLRYPMFVDLADKGYQLYSFENPRTYENKGGVRYRTLEKDGVRIALEPQQLLFTDPKRPNQQPQLGMGTEKDVAFHFIGVDPELRKQGKAKQALQDLIEVADKNDFTLYGEPAQLEKEGMTAEQLTNLYKRYGFKPTDESGKVIVREPGAKPQTAESEEVRPTSIADRFEPIVNPNELEQKAIEIYKNIKAQNPDADVDEEIENPNRYHTVVEEDNPLGIKVGDFVYTKGNPEPEIAVTVEKNSVKLIDPKTGRGGFSQYDQVSKEPIPHDYKFNFGFGDVDVDISQWNKQRNEWQFSLYGPGASETGYRSVLAVPFEGKRGTKAFDEFVERVVKANALTKAPKPKKPTKAEQAEINKARQAEKKAAAETKKAKPAKVEKPVAEAKEEEISAEDMKRLERLVELGRIAERSNVTMERAVDAYKKATDKQKALDTTETNLEREAKDKLFNAAALQYSSQIGRAPKNTNQLLNAIKNGSVSIANTSYEKDFYDVYKIKPKAAPKVEGVGTDVAEQINKFNAGNFSDGDVNPEVYKKAAVKFLESPLTAKMPSKNESKIQAKDLTDVKPLPIPKKFGKTISSYEDQKKAMLEIAAKKDIRYYLNGIHLNKAKKRMEATDGHRLAIINDANFTGEPTTKAKLYVVDKDNNVIEGQYPDLERVLPKKHATGKATVSMQELGDFARGVQKGWRYIASNYNPMIFDVNGKKIGFNSDYIVDMADLFQKLGYKDAVMSIDDGGRMYATSPDGKVEQVVMSMRDPSSPFVDYKIKTRGKKVEELPMVEPSTYEERAPEIIEDIRQEKISEYAQARAATRRITKKVAKYGSDIPLQKELNTLLEIEEELKDYLDATKPTRNSAEDFMARATKELADGNISPEVEGFIRTTFEKYPKVLEGLRLSVRSQKEGGRQAGNFNPYHRIVTLWKEGSGVEDPKTVRHELTHSLELMMTPETKKVLVDQWARAFEQAMKVHTDKQSQKYFDAVLEFLADPTKENLDKATKVMPSYDFYQYMNPSEYWAVNAEAMLGAKLGGAWSKFTNGLKKLLEGLKSFFGMNNKYELHKAMDKLLKGEAARAGEETLVDYLTRGKYKLDYLANVEDTDALLEKHSRPTPPIHPSQPVKDAFMGGYDKAKNTVRNIQQEPLMATNNMIGKVDRAITEQRNKNIFYGTGLELADRQRYGGQVRNAHKQAIASVALVNAIHSGHIATQVMTQGKLIFNQDTQMFQAAKSDKSMANVVRAKAKLVEKLGDVRAAKVIQAFFEAKRSRSIINEYLDRTAAYEAALDSGESVADASRDLKNIEIAMQKIQMTDEAIDDFIKLDQKYPELREMMDNWTAVNQNMIDMMEFSGLISKQRAKTLRGIKDYVPWYRVMDDMEDVHSAPGGTRGMTNVSREKKFKSGEVDRDIDDIVDNMIHNVLTLTRNSMRNYAANRIVMEYGTRNEKGKIKVFPSEGSDKDGVRFNIVAAGKRIVVQIKDPLVAEAVIGMENIDIPMFNALAYLANGLRRSITTFPAFQIAQLFMDAPTAALVTGLKNPGKVWATVFTSFLKNLRKDDPIVAKLRSYGIGGYQSSARTPEKEIQMDIGLIQGSWFAKAMKGLDRFGDASDYAQRRAVYMQTLKETGDELLAIFQANNVIDFQKRGSGQIAQAVTRTVAFMNAYAQSIDVLAKGLAGGGIKGLSRRQAIARMAATGMLLTASTIVYCMLVGDDDEYNKLDDQTKMRNIYIPGLNMRLPMHTGASFFFKAIPELIYNAVMKEGTKDEYDQGRLKRALGKAALDSLLGPNITPTGVKPVVEIILNKNFFTGGQVTPKGMEDLAAFRQYNQNTSELGKIISSLTGTEKTRLLNPMEADHLVRGLLGTAGAAVMWGSNMLIGNRPDPQAKDNPFYGQFIMPDVARGREDLYYDLKGKTDEAYKTHQDLLKKGRKEEAAEWFKENKDLIKVYGYTSSIETNLKEINGEIRRLSDLPEGKMDPKQKRERINELQEIKMRVLKDVISMRKRAGL